ncbi:PAS domain S-box protein [Flavobacterium sp.]|jgi:PAS domain S-box-containing protein|uniref:PAS domain S-box protein n=1 Tax=Flavobacterium sp. TaxID=239 RepID=UPI0037BEBBCB
MKNQENQYARSLIEASLDPLVTINIDGKIMDMNQATINITGLSREELTDSDFFDYFTEPQKAREVYQEVFANGSVADSPLTLRHNRGKLTDVLFNGSIYKDENQKVLGVVIVARDIAEQKWALDLKNANKELAFQNKEKEKRAAELVIANKELAFQNEEKEKRANELTIANKELVFQNQEKENRASELTIANKELVFQNKEKQNRADELLIANKELEFQTHEKRNRANELVIAGKELNFQNQEKEKRVVESKELEAYNYSLKLASQYSLSLIEASRDPLFTISLEGKITDTNQASVRVTDVSKEDLIGSDFINYFTEPELAKKGYEEVFAKGFVVDYPLVLIDGKLTSVLFNGSVYKDADGNVIGAVVVARDITEQKKAEKELIEAKALSENATGIAEEALIKAENATRVAVDSVKAKQQFLSNMSHEIRTPMNAIIGFTKVVLKTDLSAKQREYLQAIKISGDALIVLINDILDLAKVDSGKMTFEKVPFKLEVSLSAMIHLFDIKCQEKNILLIKEYDSNIPEVLLGDPVRLHQIILNLVSNAVKFTSEGKVVVSVKLVEENNDNVIIEFAVSDTGIGILDSKLSTIFENFQQASSGTSRLYGGTGLGLAIVKQLVEGQNGTIKVQSIFNVGSVFSFQLSFQKTNLDADLLVEIEEVTDEVQNINVLVVEDIALNQLLMRTLLDDFGFGCDIASNGQIAIDKMSKSHYDIILMDLQMPVMNGFEATKYIRNTLKSNIPIIALTADVTTADLSKCNAVGMNDYIAKPVNERLLYSKIVKILDKKNKETNEETVQRINQVRCTDLNYLMQRTKSNPALMSEMILLYLNQTPPLVSTMKQSYIDKDWSMLYATVHKLIPSFSIVGIHQDFEIIAKKVQEFANQQLDEVTVLKMVTQLETICLQACKELEEELITIKNSK